MNRNLADWIQTQVTEDIRHIAPEWTRRQLKEANYCETRVPVVPSIILELLSHILQSKVELVVTNGRGINAHLIHQTNLHLTLEHSEVG